MEPNPDADAFLADTAAKVALAPIPTVEPAPTIEVPVVGKEKNRNVQIVTETSTVTDSALRAALGISAQNNLPEEARIRFALDPSNGTYYVLQNVDGEPRLVHLIPQGVIDDILRPQSAFVANDRVQSCRRIQDDLHRQLTGVSYWVSLNVY